MPRITRHCQRCNTPITLYRSDITPPNIDPANPKYKLDGTLGRYKGLYCSNCVNHCRHIPVFYKRCTKCNMFFSTTNNNEDHCCDECLEGD